MYSKNKTKQVVVRLSDEQYKIVSSYAEIYHCSKSEFVRILLDYFAVVEGSQNEKK